MSMGLMVVLAIGIATAVWAGIERVTPDAPPVAEPTTASGITYSQATARAYHEWQEWTRWEQCLEAEGYPGYAHLETEVALAPDVAAHLGIEPATQHPDRPVVDLRESPFWTGAQEDARYDQLMSLEHPDSCWPERTALDVADGRAVAVKVQYPGVAEAITTDLENADSIFQALTFLFPGLDPEPVVAELRERLVEELDYLREAADQQVFADRHRGHPTIRVPEVLHDLTTSRVLTTELAEGVRFDEMLRWPEHERNLAAETIYRFAFGSLYGLGMFNGDPHPGNYLFEEGGRVTFLDYGLVKHFTDDELAGFEALIQAVVTDPDPSRLRQVLVDLGLLRASDDLDDDLVFEYFSHFYEFVRVDGPYTIDDAYASHTVRHMFDAAGPYGPVMRAANVPPSFVVIQRINLGLYAIFGQIGATANWRRIAEELWSFTDGPPSTPMGEAIARWAADRRARPALREM